MTKRIFFCRPPFFGPSATSLRACAPGFHAPLKKIKCMA